MKTVNKVQTEAAGLAVVLAYIVERGDAREVPSNPKEPRTQALLELVL